MSLSSGRFTLVERQQMGEILEEQGFQQSGCVSSECAVEVGAALGAKFIVIGSISKVGTLFSVNARFLDVETSQIIQSISHSISQSVSWFPLVPRKFRWLLFIYLCVVAPPISLCRCL